MCGIIVELISQVDLKIMYDTDDEIEEITTDDSYL